MCNLFGFKWPEQIRCLGVYLGHNKKLNDIKNFEEKVNNIEVILKRWKKRELPLFGRVLILKIFALSKFVLPVQYVCHCTLLNELMRYFTNSYGDQKIKKTKGGS